MNKQMRKAIAAGKKQVPVECIACAGTGYYDVFGSPKCSACNGTGKIEVSRLMPKHGLKQNCM